jgi:hypothetical protein
LREIAFNGFYLVKDGTVTLVGSNEGFAQASSTTGAGPG